MEKFVTTVSAGVFVLGPRPSVDVRGESCKSPNGWLVASRAQRIGSYLARNGELTGAGYHDLVDGSRDRVRGLALFAGPVFTVLQS